MKLNEAIEVLKKFKEWANTPTHGSSKYDLIKLFGAIDTVLSHINTENKKGLDDRLQEKSIEVSDSQGNLSYKKDGELPTDEQIEQYALENILDGVGIQSMINTKAWIAGARWMRGLIQERREK